MLNCLLKTACAVLRRGGGVRTLRQQSFGSTADVSYGLFGSAAEVSGVVYE